MKQYRALSSASKVSWLVCVGLSSFLMIILLQYISKTDLMEQNYLVPGHENWVLELKRKAKKIHSQGNQDGIIEEIFSHIKPKHMRYVEFGFGYVKNESTAIESKLEGTNSYQLSKTGWTGWLFDAVVQMPSIGLYKELLTPENIVQVFKKHKIPKDVDYISIDVDSLDLWLLRALIKNGDYAPTLITIEFNSNFPYGSTITCDAEWQSYRGDIVYGTSIGAILEVALKAKYEPVYVEGQLDVFLVRRDLLIQSKGSGLTYSDLKLMFPMPRKLHKVLNDSKFERFIDFKVFEQTGDKHFSRMAAIQDVSLAIKLHL